jgi:stage II sporulation protein D
MMPSKQRVRVAGLLLVALAAGAPREASSAEVRVRLFERAEPQAITVSADRGLFFFSDDDDRGSALAELRPYEKATIQRRGDDLYVTFRETTFHARALRLMPRDDALFSVEVTEGQLLREPRRYPGSLSLTISRAATPMLMLVNHVRLDEYVACVVSREYSFNDLEGTKAMAVLARTYVLRNASATGDAYDLVDHQMDQHYEGANRLTDAAIEATIQTLGEVLTYNGRLVEAVYFSSSGGHTADNEAVWNGKPVPYLRGVPDPYDAVSPHARWRSSIPRAALLGALSKHYNSTVEDFRISERSRDGRVQTIELVRPARRAQVIQGNDFRLLINKIFGMTSLKSTFFEVEHSDQAYVFEGRGFGHGVGLSQYGALGMSKQGFSYRAILSFYFTGTQVQRWTTG